MGAEGRHLLSSVAIVTGAASGIGAAVAARLATAGSRLVLADPDGGGLADLERRLGAAGTPTLAELCDVTNSADCARVVAAAESFGRIDTLVNAAGILGKPAHLTELSDAEFDRVMAVNVRGTWSMIRRAAPLMRDGGGGSVVNLASTASTRGAATMLAYVASKHAVVGVTRSAALELAPWGIRVNAVAPGPTMTPMMQAVEGADVDPASAGARLAAKIPLGRYATADEVAAVVAFLASGDAQFVTGAVYPVDGGRTAGEPLGPW